MPPLTSFTLQTIGIVHSCYKEKFGIPRQPGLVTEATARLELIPPYNRLDTLDGIDGFSHIWIQFIFHACISESWKAKIRPPRLGGKTKMGVFATRATHRPNPIGLSVVKIGRIYQENKKVFIDLHGADLLDGTPVLDIKPYLPYADNIANAKDGFAPPPVKTQIKPVVFSDLAKTQCEHYQNLHNRDIATLIRQVIEQDPRPSYLSEQLDREHGITLWELNVKWCARNDHFEILRIEQ
ncbi:tRNA (N6-threonylcarbamoyladenosine(37)-N6)-methyltransferase TrmO [Marinomonas sp. M1K-6]|uniref:tRNA (N6-threonylcarbamoyladenosine(37)-N6)-methyltransferase TrmO n=1 Tax=Marinomonas profundi TaxID=2726122 RepID=A0A847QVZ0_9GAMM|nr:tRNA (N6-threonylcarbamoyladenosine(37)-N6)-methyltransferase TrmO [Marinomonas profundi]NLQ16089.1 tRNA (N6-threonylcarbamoyladenosine(37)-N6)-methyltransferase TrmO [Marinomonas profundi]UDV03324.1 tRNA (N6-threonylcarbamoyladenosine(37)-N6)-methyltransferase TrmO [Marinomonas profundi]